jgi:hypothetical protein
MNRTEHIVNNWPGIVDLSPLTDVQGRRLVLQPKGMDGSSKEVHAEVAEHTHVQRFVGARWVRRLRSPDPDSPSVVAPDVPHIELSANERNDATSDLPPPQVMPQVELADAAQAGASPVAEADMLIVEPAPTSDAAPVATEAAVNDASGAPPAAEGRGRKRR